MLVKNSSRSPSAAGPLDSTNRWELSTWAPVTELVQFFVKVGESVGHLGLWGVEGMKLRARE